MASVAREFLEKNFQRTIINQNFHEKKIRKLPFRLFSKIQIMSDVNKICFLFNSLEIIQFLIIMVI